MTWHNGKIAEVAPASPAAKAGLKPGDTLLAINGQELADVIDYQYYSMTDKLDLVWLDEGGKQHTAFLQMCIRDSSGINGNLF